MQHRERIVIPQRVINGGLDFKFETDPYHVNLRGLLTPDQYTDVITALNETLQPSRSKSIDTMLLATGALMIPLAVWGMRHGMLTKRRKRLLRQYIQNFNTSHETLYMRWNRRPESSLTIERKLDQGVAQQTPAAVQPETIQTFRPLPAGPEGQLQ